MSGYIEDLSQHNVLVFDRNSAVFQKMVRDVMTKSYGVTKYDTISEYKIADHYIDLGKYEYFDLNTKDYEILAKIDIKDVIARDRWLRELTYDEAFKKVKVCFKFCVEFFQTHNYTAVFSQIVDNYVMDVFFRVARLFDLKTVGICRFFYSGYHRITLFGEHNTVRTPGDEEVKKVMDALVSRNFVSSMAPSFKWALKNSLLLYAKYKAKCLVHFGIYGMLLRRTEFDYVARISSSAYPKSVGSFLAFRHLQNMPTVQRWLKKNDKPVVYLALHYFPEATIDYWASDSDAVNYLQSIVEVITSLKAKGYRILIKEHPAMVFARPPVFYKDLQAVGQDDAILCTPFATSREIFAVANKVVVWTGSVGVEAALCGLPVVKVCDNYYSAHKKFISYRDIEKAQPFSPEERFELLKTVLSGTIPN